MEKFRTFIAIDLPGEVKQHLESIESLIRSGNHAPVKWVEPFNIHLTLKFLGDIDSGTVDDISGTVQEAVSGIGPFRLEIDGLGVFPSEKKPQVVWAGLKGDLERLNGIKDRLETGLEGLGYPRDSKRFSPHVTLARIRDRADRSEREQLGKLVTGTTIKPLAFTVDAVNFMRSQLTKTGPIYTRLNSFLLK